MSYRASQTETFNALAALHHLGHVRQAMQAGRTVFGATQLGIPLELARVFEVLGVSQGQAPGQAIRAGNCGKRTRETRCGEAVINVSEASPRRQGGACSCCCPSTVRACAGSPQSPERPR